MSKKLKASIIKYRETTVKTIQRFGKAGRFIARVIEKCFTGAFIRNAIYSRYYENLKINENLVLYESRHGARMIGNPYAIFKYLINNNRYKNLIHIWVINDTNDNSEIIKQYKENKNIVYVRRHSKKYIKYLCSAKYLINNISFSDYYTHKEGQIYINTWHGTPLKHLGFDMLKDSVLNTRNVLRNFLSAQYILCENEYMTDMFMKSYKLNGLYKGKFIQEGYPRSDLTINSSRTDIFYRLKKAECEIEENKKIILYAPTFRDSIVEPRNNIATLLAEYNQIKEAIDLECYQLILKVHPFVYKHAVKEDGISKICVPDFMDANEILSITDILITDYSSIFVDFLSTGRPVLFYMKDISEYSEDRGLYISTDELPGPVSETIVDLLDNIEHIENVMLDYKKKYEFSVAKFSSKNNGNVTERIVDIIFNNHTDGYDIVENDFNKSRLLFYTGGMTSNGITFSLLSLLNNIDYNLYDVTVLIPSTEDKVRLNNIEKISDKARRILRFGAKNATVFEMLKERYVLRKGVSSKFAKILYKNKYFKREFKRMFGNSEFDCLIEFNGYSMVYANFFLQNTAKKKIIFLHNDMLADSNRCINGDYPHKKSLESLFTVYDKFDELISVSESCMIANRKNLSLYARKEKFSYIPNTIDVDKILTNAMNSTTDGILLPCENEISFVTIGRLSPEKDHAKLINAFNIVYEKYKNIKLYIIGTGPLESDLKRLAGELELSHCIYFTGLLENPHFLLNLCDCFVLSSNYEGQPLVLLEALLLRKSIIATNIVACCDVLQNGKYGELVDNSVDGLISGMCKYIESGITSEPFDYDEYVNMAMETFYSKL